MPRIIRRRTRGTAAFLLLGAALLLLAGSTVVAGEVVPEGGHAHGLGVRIAGLLRSSGLPDGLVIVLIAALPVVELRGAVPVGHMLGMHPLTVYVLAVLGNMVPIPFLLWMLGPCSRLCMRVRIGRRFFEWLFARTRRKTAKVEKYETLGLTVFVSIPLPVTGGWTGSIAAFLMGLRFRHAFLSILLGVMVAGVIMTALSLLGWWGAGIAAVALTATAAAGVWKSL